MGRWAQAQRAGSGSDPLGWLVATISDLVFESTVTVFWDSEVGSYVWNLQLQRLDGTWQTVYYDAVSAELREKDTGVPAGTLWFYRARIRAWSGSAWGPWSPWLVKRAP